MDNPNSESLEMLGIGAGATEAEITGAYRRLAKKYHPGLSNSDPVRTAKLKKLTTAYESLVSKEQRNVPLQSSGGNAPGFIYEVDKTEPEKTGSARSRKIKVDDGSSKSILILTTVLLLIAGAIGYIYVRDVNLKEKEAAKEAAQQVAVETANNHQTTAPVQTTETLPDVPDTERLTAPPAKFFVPNQAKLHSGFAYAKDASVYTKDFYKTIYTLDDTDGKKVLSFSESETPYVPPTTGGPGFQIFEYLGHSGYLTVNPLADGTVDGLLHWGDRDFTLLIHITGMSANKFSGQNLFDMLGALQHSEPALPPAPVPVPLITNTVKPKPNAIVTTVPPCRLGANCFKYNSMMHRFFRQQNKADQQPS